MNINEACKIIDYDILVGEDKQLEAYKVFFKEFFRVSLTNPDESYKSLNDIFNEAHENLYGIEVEINEPQKKKAPNKTYNNNNPHHPYKIYVRLNKINRLVKTASSMRLGLDMAYMRLEEVSSNFECTAE